MHYIEVYFYVVDKDNVNIAIPGFTESINVPFKEANIFIRENWGNQYQLVKVGDDFTGSIDSGILYLFLINNKVDINKYIESEYEITDEADFDVFLTSLRERDDE